MVERTDKKALAKRFHAIEPSEQMKNCYILEKKGAMANMISPNL